MSVHENAPPAPRAEVSEDERYAAFSQTLLNLCPIVVQDEKEDGSRSLGRSSDTSVYYGGLAAASQRGWGKREERRERGERRERFLYTRARDARLWRNQNRPLFVTSGYLAGHFRTRVGTYSGHCGLPDISMSRSKLPSNIIVVFDFSMSVAGSASTPRVKQFAGF